MTSASPRRRAADLLRVHGMRPWEVAALEVPLAIRVGLGVALGAVAVAIADVLDLSSGWALLPAVGATVVAVGLLGVSAATAATLVAAIGLSAFVFGESGNAEGSESALIAVFVISAGFIVAMGGRLRFLTKRLFAAYEIQGAQQDALEATWAQLVSLTDSAPAGMCLVDQDLRFLKVNQEMARLNGLSVEEHVGRRVSEVPGLDPQALEAFRRVLAGGPAIRDRELSTIPSGATHARHLLTSWFPVRKPDGQVIGAGALVQDITRRKVAEERLWLLAELSDMLEEPLDPQARAQALAHLLVPRMADLSMVLARSPGRGLTLQAIACADPARGVLAADMIDRYPEALETAAFARVLEGETVVINDYLPVRDAVSASHLEALRAMGVGAAACFPIVGRERRHGALLLAKFAPTPGFDGSEVAFTQTIIARAAVALDNAYLYDRMSTVAEEEHERAELLARMESRQRYIANTLQQSLLPDALPELPSLALASAFRPAGLGLEVGGDTFDIFDVDDQWVAYIADVCGKGPHAAARTGLVRYTVRAEARHNADPVELLRLVNAAMLRSGSDESASFVTMVVVNVRRRDDGDLDVTVASGGHPAPILLHEGHAGELPVTGTVVGAFDDAEFGCEHFRLRPGDVLLLYTDGVTEARAGAEDIGDEVDLFGEERLLASVQQAYARGVVNAHGVVDAVVADIDAFSGGQLRDDLAVLAMQLLPIPTIAKAGLPQQRAVLGEIGRPHV